MVCSCQILCQMIASILIILLSIPIIPIYVVVCLPIALIVLCICKCIGCVSMTIFDFYICGVFWPYTWLLCWIKIPFIRYKYGYRALYLGKIKRNHLQNNYHQLKQDMDFVDINELNTRFESLRDENCDIIRIICVSDTHGRHCWLTDCIPNGDIFIHCGDITFQGNGGLKMLQSFDEWMKQFQHKYKFVIGGNHDRFMPSIQYPLLKNNIFKNCIYLDTERYSITEFNNLSIFACAWSPKGSDNNAFQTINDDILTLNHNPIDIFLTHSDMSNLSRYYGNKNQKINDIINCIQKCNACIQICGHFHARYGVKIKTNFYTNGGDMFVVNCSSLDGRYVPTHYPIVFDLDLST